MYRKSRMLFIFLLWLLSSSFIGCFYYSLGSFFMADAGSKSLWINFLIYPIVLFSILIYMIPGLLLFIRSFMTSIVVFAVLIGFRYLMIQINAGKTIEIIDMIPLIVFSSIISGLIWIVIPAILPTFDFIYQIVSKENSFKNNESYVSWIKGTVGDKGARLETTWFISSAFTYFILMLLLCFISIAKEPSIKVLQSVYLCSYAASALGIYMLVFQFNKIIQWHFSNIPTNKSVLDNWNRLINLIFIPVIAF